MMDVLLSLDEQALDHVSSCFRSVESSKHGKGLNLNEFIAVMTDAVAQHRDGEHDEDDSVIELERFRRDLCKLFSEIDIDGDGTVTWEEFSEHCIDVGVAATIIPIDKSSLCWYKEKRGFKDRHCKQPSVIKWIPDLEKVFVCESHSRNVKVLSQNLKKLYCDIDTALSEHHLEDGRRSKSPYYGSKVSSSSQQGIDHQRLGNRIVSVEYCPVLVTDPGRSHNQLGTLVFNSNALTTTFWEVNQYATTGTKISLLNVVVGKVNAPQAVAQFCRFSRRLYTSGADGVIYVWQVDIAHGGTLISKCTIRNHHKGCVTAIISSARHHLMFTSALDGRISMWETVTFAEEPGETVHLKRAPRCIGELMGHRLGVTGIDLVLNDSVLVSVGFEHEAYCWDVLSRVLLCKLQGHRTRLIGVKGIPSNEESQQQIASVDQNGNIRIWILSLESCTSSKVSCMQELSPWSTISPRCFEILGNSRTLVLGGFQLVLFEPLAKTQSLEREGLKFVGLAYNAETCCFVAGLGKSVWIWDGNNRGQVDRTFHDIVNAEITALTVDRRGRKLAIGTQDGQIHIFNFLNGSKLRSCTPHRADVSALHWIDEDACLVSASWDKTLCVHCEMSIISLNTGTTTGYEMRLMRKVEGAHQADIVALAVSRELSLIATAGSDFSIKIWDFQTIGFEGSCNGHNSEIAGVSFLRARPGLVSADCDGTIMIWATRPRWNRYGKPLQVFPKFSPGMTCFEVIIQETSQPGSIEKATSLVSGESIRMIIGTEHGSISVYDLSQILDSNALSPLPKHKRPANWPGYNPRKQVQAHSGFGNDAGPKQSRSVIRKSMSRRRAMSFSSLSVSADGSAIGDSSLRCIGYSRQQSMPAVHDLLKPDLVLLDSSNVGIPLLYFRIFAENRYVATVDSSNAILIWQLHTWEEIGLLQVEQKSYRGPDSWKVPGLEQFCTPITIPTRRENVLDMPSPTSPHVIQRARLEHQHGDVFSNSAQKVSKNVMRALAQLEKNIPASDTINHDKLRMRKTYMAPLPRPRTAPAPASQARLSTPTGDIAPMSSFLEKQLKTKARRKSGKKAKNKRRERKISI